MIFFTFTDKLGVQNICIWLYGKNFVLHLMFVFIILTSSSDYPTIGITRKLIILSGIINKHTINDKTPFHSLVGRLEILGVGVFSSLNPTDKWKFWHIDLIRNLLINFQTALIPYHQKRILLK